MGPLGGYLMKLVDKFFEDRVPAGFEMLVANFSAGILGAILAVLGLLVVNPVVTGVSDFLGSGVDLIVSAKLLPIASIFIEPAKILFLNNAINHGVLSPLGIAQAEEAGKSLSSELHRCRQELHKAHELYKNKLTEMEQYKTLVESEMDGLEQERDDAIQQILELEKNLEKLTVAIDSNSRESSIAATTELENELAETRLKLALAQSERDEMELTTVGLDVHDTLHTKSKAHFGKGDNFCSPSSSGSENSSNRNGESWFRVDSMVE